MNIWINASMHRCMDGWTDEDGWTEEWMVGQMNEWMNGMNE